MSVANFIQVVQVTAQLLPVVIDAIKAVEAAIPGQGKGEQKLALVRGMLETAFVTVQDVTVKFEQVWPVISATISNLVAIYNKIGAFKK